MKRIALGNVIAVVLGALLWWTDFYRDYVLLELRWGYVARAAIYIAIVAALFSAANWTGFKEAGSSRLRVSIVVGFSIVEAAGLWFIMNMAVVEGYCVTKDGMTFWL